MNGFEHSAEAAAFVESSDSRETSTAVMKAIVRFSSSIEEAEFIWENGLPGWEESDKARFIAEVTGEYGEPEDFCWGASGSRWASEL